jgi:hypothetical protein
MTLSADLRCLDAIDERCDDKPFFGMARGIAMTLFKQSAMFLGFPHGDVMKAGKQP